MLKISDCSKLRGLKVQRLFLSSGKLRLFLDGILFIAAPKEVGSAFMNDSRCSELMCHLDLVLFVSSAELMTKRGLIINLIHTAFARS